MVNPGEREGVEWGRGRGGRRRNGERERFSGLQVKLNSSHMDQSNHADITMINFKSDWSIYVTFLAELQVSSNCDYVCAILHVHTNIHIIMMYTIHTNIYM